MKERLKLLDYKYSVLTGIFIVIFAVSFVAPLAGNDWAYAVKSSSLTYNEGGLLSDYLANLFINSKGIFALVFAFIMTYFYYAVSPLFGKVENKYHFLLIPFFLLVLSIETIGFNILSVTGVICYTLPSIAIILYYLYLYKLGNEKYKIKDYIFLLILSSFIILTTVHLAIAFLISNIIYYAYRVVTYRGFPKLYILLLLIQIVAIFTSLIYMDKSLVYSSFDLVFGSVPKFINQNFSKNIVLFIIGLIPINYYMNSKLGKFSYKRVIIVLFDLIPILSLIYNFFNYSPFNLNLIINKYNGIFATENWYFIFYYIVYMLLYVLSIIKIIQRPKSRMYILTMLLTGLLTSIFILVSPSFVYGSNILFILTFIISLSVAIKEMNINLKKSFAIVTVLLVIYYGILVGMSRYIDYTREKYVDEQLANGYTVVEVRSDPIMLIYRHNPITPFQMRDYKKYKNISEDIKIEVKFSGIFKTIGSKVINSVK